MAFKAIISAAIFFLGVAAWADGMVVISAGDFFSPVNECARGPEYWCANVMNAKSCRATKHCIQTVWERQSVPEDNDSICEICKQMVQEARDQLQSNETQEELKEVFEGSCKLIPVKMVRMNCIKVVDEFIPELIEMLSSQMNPTVVCTTALLCNNAWADNLLAEYKAARETTSSSGSSAQKCGICKSFMNRNLDKLQTASMGDVLGVLFNVCDRTSSFSDGCKSIVSDNIEKIYQHLLKSVSSDACQPLGFCEDESEIQQPLRVSVMPLSNDRKWRAKFEATSAYSDDMECEFCQTLIKNLRSILVSNTTEAEFIQVLNGLCKQTGQYAAQCQNLVAQYGEAAYQFMMHELDPVQACQLLTLCPWSSGLKSSGSRKSMDSPFYLEVKPADVIKATKLIPAKRVDHSQLDDEIMSNDLFVGQDEANGISSSLQASDFVLPSQILMPESLSPKKPTCVLCQYVLHQLVEDLNNVTVQEEIEATVKSVCKRLPSAVGDECNKLIDTYGDAILFLLTQELDPSVLCVQLQLCTSTGTNEVKLPEHPFAAGSNDPNTCALCEFVISTLDKKLQDNKTEESIKTALENVCNHMPSSVRKDCVRLVDAYSKEIVEALLADLTPDEVCAALKLCNPKSEEKISSEGGITLGEFLKKIENSQSSSAAVGTLGEFLSRLNGNGNDEPSDKKVKQWTSSSSSSTTSNKNSPTCVMCEFAMSALEKQFITNKTAEEVKRAVDFVCAHLPTTVADMCIDFVEQYGDEIFQLLISEVAPKAICTQVGLCTPLDTSLLLSDDVPPKPVHLLGRMNEHEIQDPVGMPSKCEICETVVEYLDKLLEDDTIEESIDHIVERACVVIPHGVRDKCTEMVETYGPYILAQIGELMNKTKICQSLHLCKPPPGLVQLLGGKQCTWGPAYWCTSLEHADACNAVSHCQTKVWMKAEP